MIRILFVFLLWGVVPSMGFSQQVLSSSATKDLTRRSMEKIERFMNYVETIGAAKYSRRTRLKGIELGKLLFTKDAIIEEQSRNSPKTFWTPHNYLYSLLNRGQKSPRIISFDVIDDLLPSELESIINADGSTSYTGKIKVKQYYCTLKSTQSRKEPTSRDPDINCSYKDTTIKEIIIEIRRIKSRKGEIWVTLISYIRVEKVF